MIDLKPFCARPITYSKYSLEEPFAVDGWEYATDGKICVRIPTRKPSTVAGDQRKLPDVSLLEWKTIAKVKEWKPILAVGKTMKADDPLDCTDCRDKLVTCPDCRSRVGCHRCRWSGVIGPRCTTCKSKRRAAGMPVRKIGKCLFDMYFIRKMRELSECEVPLWEKVDIAMPFRFQGGEGFVMPLSGDIKCSEMEPEEIGLGLGI